MVNRIKSFSEYIGSSNLSESLRYHVDNNISITESIYRPGSQAHLEVLNEARNLYKSGLLKLGQSDAYLFDTTDLGETAIYEGEVVGFRSFFFTKCHCKRCRERREEKERQLEKEFMGADNV